MATSGVMADYARLPASRKVLIFVVVGLLLGLLYYRFGYKSLIAHLDEANALQQSQQAKFARNKDDLPKYVHLQEDMIKLTDDITQNQKALPTEAEVPAFFDTLERKVRESGVEILRWTKKPEEPVEEFVKVPVEIEISGTFLQLKRFFASLVQRDVGAAPVPVSVPVPTPGAGSADGAAPVVQAPPPVPPEKPSADERERIVSIENLVVTHPEVRNREIYLTAKFTAVTFRQEDNATPPTPGAAQPPPAPGAAPPTDPAQAPAAPGTPALPSAATPAGAKARVEDAMKKDESRTRNAEGSAARLGGGL